MVIKAKTSLPSKTKDSEVRLGQKFGGPGEELSYTLSPPKKTAEKPGDSEENLLVTLQKIYDLFEAEPGLTREIKNKLARILAQYYHQEEPGFTVDEAYKAIIRDYHLARDIAEVTGKSKSSSTPKLSAREKSKTQPQTRTQPKAAKEPTLAEIMNGRPFSPSDFMLSARPPKTGHPNQFGGFNPMMGLSYRSAPVRRGGRNRGWFPRPIGFMMGPGIPMPGFFRYPW